MKQRTNLAVRVGVIAQLLFFLGGADSSQFDFDSYEVVSLEALNKTPEKYNSKKISTAGVYDYSGFRSHFLGERRTYPRRGLQLIFTEKTQEINAPADIRPLDIADFNEMWEKLRQNPSLGEDFIEYSARVYGTFAKPAGSAELAKLVVEKIIYLDKLRETVRDHKVKAIIREQLRLSLGDATLKVEQIVDEHETNIFINHKLLRITVSSSARLEHSLLPSLGDTRGMFAYAKGRLLYLNHSNGNFEKLLWDERNKRKKELDPERLTQALIAVKIPRNNTGIRLVRSLDDILIYNLNGYSVDEERVLPYRNTIIPPRWEEKQKTKDLIFFGLSGWMHEINTLVKVTASFDKASSNLTITTTNLEDSVFKKMPNRRY